MYLSSPPRFRSRSTSDTIPSSPRHHVPYNTYFVRLCPSLAKLLGHDVVYEDELELRLSNAGLLPYPELLDRLWWWCTS